MRPVASLFLPSAAVVGVLLFVTSCAPGSPRNPQLTLETAKADLHDLAADLVSGVPADVVAVRHDDWTNPRTLLPCPGVDNAYIYPGLISLDLTPGTEGRPYLDALSAKFEVDPDWKMTRDEDVAVLLTSTVDETYIAVRSRSGAFRASGFSACFTMDGYSPHKRY